MRRHGCAVLAFLLGLPGFGAVYLSIKMPDVWNTILDVVTVLLIVLWFLVFGYFVWTVWRWVKHRRAARMQAAPRREELGTARRGTRVEQGRGKQGQTANVSNGGRRIL